MSLTEERIAEGRQLVAELRAAGENWSLDEAAITRLERAQSALDFWITNNLEALFEALQREREQALLLRYLWRFRFRGCTCSECVELHRRIGAAISDDDKEA